MNISSIGESFIELLVEQKIVQSLPDLYTLTTPETLFLLKRFPGIAHKKIEVLIEELNKSKSNEARRFINALGIPGIGIKLAKEIEKNLLALEKSQSSGRESLSISKIFQIISSQEFLGSIYGIGETIIQEINKWINNPKHKKLIQQFEHYNIQAQISDKYTQ